MNGAIFIGSQQGSSRATIRIPESSSNSHVCSEQSHDMQRAGYVLQQFRLGCKPSVASRTLL